MVDMTNESSALFFELLQQTVVNSNYLSTEEVRFDWRIIQHFLLLMVCVYKWVYHFHLLYTLHYLLLFFFNFLWYWMFTFYFILWIHFCFFPGSEVPGIYFDSGQYTDWQPPQMYQEPHPYGPQVKISTQIVITGVSRTTSPQPPGKDLYTDSHHRCIKNHIPTAPR